MILSIEKHKVLLEQGDFPMINFIAQEVRHSLAVLYKPMYIIVDADHMYMLTEEITDFMGVTGARLNETYQYREINVMNYWLPILERPEHVGINVLSTPE